MFKVVSDEALSFLLISRTFGKRFGKACELHALLTARQITGLRQILAL